MKKGMLICFMGIDGSGKTTLAKKLADELSKRDLKCEYLWWLEAENSAVRRMLRLLSHSNNKSKNKSACNKRSKGKFPMFIYQYLVILDYLRQLILKVWLPLKRGKVLVCDRYIYDTIIALSIEFKYSAKKYHRLINLFEFLSPKPDIFFMIDVPADIAFKRKDDIPSIECLLKPITLYKELCKQIDVKVIDGAKNLEELSGIVCNEVLKYVG